MSRAFLLLLLPLLVGGCRSADRPSPFTPVGEVSDEDVVRILRSRTEGVRTLYAVVKMVYQGPDQDGAFDAVMNYRAPGHFRFTAFKDLVLMEHDIFDLVLRPPGYQVRYEAEGDGEPKLHEGQLVDLPRDHPTFSGFAWAGPAFFLAGRIGERAEVERDGDVIRVHTDLPGNVPVTWVCAPATLEVLRARVRPRRGRQLVLTYAGYGKRSGMFFPDDVTYSDPQAEVKITAEADDVEVNPGLEDDLFELEPE